MGVRQRVPLPFGEGIDRATGAMLVDPSVFNDIRNVNLTKGRAEMRGGLERALLIAVPAGYTDLLGVYPVRAQGLSGAIAYNSVTREVGLFAVDSSGTAYAFIDVLWVLPAGATSPPRISATDQYDQLVIAHDEPIYPLRQQTMVYSAVEATVGPLMLDLARLGATEPVYFRGVQKHLAYIVAWGYGTNAAGQGDRGEVLRISMPGEPTNFTPEHYFLVGTQGDPIIGAGPCAGVLAVQKVASTKYLRGTDRTTFGIADGDPSHGLLSSKLRTWVNEEYFFWSLTGPRLLAGGASADLGLPLELNGESPDALADDTAPEDGFAFYDPTEREVIFCFGRWAFVLHMKDGQRRWSFRPYAVTLLNAGSLYVGGSQVLANITAHPEPGAIAFVEPSYAVGAGNGTPKLTVPWTNVGGAGVTTETIEIWMQRDLPGEPWRRKFVGLATLLTATISVDGFWTDYNIALRYTSGGFAAPGYASSNPAVWPVASQGVGSTEGAVQNAALGKWQRFDLTTQGFEFTSWSGPGVNPPADLVGPSYLIEKSLDGISGWTTVSAPDSYDEMLLSMVFPNSDSLLSYALRMSIVGPHGASPTFAIDVRVIAPEMPTLHAVADRTDPGGPGDGLDYHNTTWAAPAAVNGEVPADGPFELKAQHFLGGTSGAFGAVVTPGVGVHVYNYPVPDQIPNSVQYFVRSMLRVALASGDVSPWSINLNGFDA